MEVACAFGQPLDARERPLPMSHMARPDRQNFQGLGFRGLGVWGLGFRVYKLVVSAGAVGSAKPPIKP